MNTTKLQIHTWPDKILRTRCKKVTNVDAQVRDLFRQMYSLMTVHSGVGLAANQVGIDLQLIIVEHQGQVFKLVNPKITKSEGSLRFLEGCLSFPGIELNIKRAQKVWVEALNEQGDPVDIETQGVLAVIFQHEIDHINGITFIDRVPLWQRLRITPKLNAIAKKV